MIKVSINEDVTVEEFSRLVDFVIKRSDTISVARYYSEFLDITEFSEMQESYKEFIYAEDAKRREYYKSNINDYQSRLKAILHLKTDTDVNTYFDEILAQDISVFQKLQYNSFSKKPDNRFIPHLDEFIKTIYTRITPVTQNPVFEMCFFKTGIISASIINKMKELYDYPYTIDGIDFEDITFYNHNNIILAVCSHERFAYLDLNDNDFETFRKIGINHTYS